MIWGKGGRVLGPERVDWGVGVEREEEGSVEGGEGEGEKREDG